MQIERVDGQGWALCGNEKVDANGGIMMWKLKGRMEKGGHYANERVDATGGNIMYKFNGQVDKGGHDDVEMKRWIQKGAL